MHKLTRPHEKTKAIWREKRDKWLLSDKKTRDFNRDCVRAAANLQNWKLPIKTSPLEQLGSRFKVT